MLDDMAARLHVMEAEHGRPLYVDRLECVFWYS